MNTERRIKTVIMVAHIPFAFSACFWRGCDRVDDTGLKTEGDYNFYEYSDHVRIRDFSLEGKNLEVCYMPAYINGKVVTSAGYDIWVSASCRLESENLKYLNIPYGVKETKGFKGLSNLQTIVISSIHDFRFYGGSDLKIYVPFGYADMYEKIDCELLNANITYLFNYGDAPNEGVYMADLKEQGEVLYKPLDPLRAGFVFDGWFTDADCKNQWDFDRKLHAEVDNGDDFKLYASWKEV